MSSLSELTFSAERKPFEDFPNDLDDREFCRFQVQSNEPLVPGRQIPVFVLLELLFLPRSFVFYTVGQGSSSNYRRSSEALYGFLPTLIIRGLDRVYPSPSSEPYRSSSTNPACSYSACICRGVYSRMEEVLRGA